MTLPTSRAVLLRENVLAVELPQTPALPTLTRSVEGDEAEEDTDEDPEGASGPVRDEPRMRAAEEQRTDRLDHRIARRAGEDRAGMTPPGCSGPKGIPPCPANGGAIGPGNRPRVPEREPGVAPAQPSALGAIEADK